MSQKSQETIGPNLDIPASTEFEEFVFLGIDGKLLLTLWKQSSGNVQEQPDAWTASSLILTDGQGG
jgi:hypothetical protein